MSKTAELKKALHEACPCVGGAVKPCDLGAAHFCKCYEPVEPESHECKWPGHALEKQIDLTVEGATDEVVQGLMRFFAASYCEKHQAEVLTESPGEFYDKEQGKCLRCLEAEGQRGAYLAVVAENTKLKAALDRTGHIAHCCCHETTGKRWTLDCPIACEEAWNDYGEHPHPFRDPECGGPK